MLGAVTRGRPFLPVLLSLLRDITAPLPALSARPAPGTVRTRSTEAPQVPPCAAPAIPPPPSIFSCVEKRQEFALGAGGEPQTPNLEKLWGPPGVTGSGPAPLIPAGSLGCTDQAHPGPWAPPGGSRPGSPSAPSSLWGKKSQCHLRARRGPSQGMLGGCAGPRRDSVLFPPSLPSSRSSLAPCIAPGQRAGILLRPSLSQQREAGRASALPLTCGKPADLSLLLDLFRFSCIFPRVGVARLPQAAQGGGAGGFGDCGRDCPALGMSGGF